MAVTTTPQDIMTAAYARSKKNQPGVSLAETTEGLKLVIRATRGLFAVAARINPTFFGAQSDVAYSAPGWLRPTTAELIYLIENAANSAPITVVPTMDRTAEEGKACVYRIGQIFRPAGNPGDPGVGVSLRFHYSKRPTDPATYATALDQLWDENQNELLILETAIYMALKDGRHDEVALLKEERDRWALQYVAFLEHETIGEVRRWAHDYFYANSLVPINSLFAGGSSLKLAS